MEEMIGMKIKKDMTLGQIMKEYPKTVRTLMGFGLGCLGCPASTGETLEEAANVHGIDLNDLLEALNKN